MLIMAPQAAAKTFMAMLFLLMMARLKPLISILERGDSYRPLVELMGGRCIDVDLEGSITLNPWDLAPGVTTPGKDKIAFLKNLTRHMLGDSPNSDTALLDNLLSESITRLISAARSGIATRLRHSMTCERNSNNGVMKIESRGSSKKQSWLPSNSASGLVRRVSTPGYSTSTPR